MKCKETPIFAGFDHVPTEDSELRLLRDIIAISNCSEEFEAALREALPRIARHYGCGASQAFAFESEERERIVLCATSYEATQGLFRRLGTPATLELAGAGYLRRVAESRLPQTTAALDADLGGRGTAALEAGLRWSLAFPVIAGGETVALIELLAEHPLVGIAMDTMASAGVALGRTVERERYRSVLHRSERLISLGTFAAGIAHELNNPLSSILVSARVARKHDYSREQLREILGEITADAERCAETVKNLVRFAHQEPGERTQVNVAELIRRVVGIARRAAEQRETRFELSIAEPLPLVLVDATAIEQALVSVLDSVLRTSRAGGSVRVEAGPVDEGLRIELCADDGRRGGACPAGAPLDGAGLEMARGIITQHGGTIRIDRQPGGSSTITIRLPASGQSPRSASG